LGETSFWFLDGKRGGTSVDGKYRATRDAGGGQRHHPRRLTAPAGPVRHMGGTCGVPSAVAFGSHTARDERLTESTRGAWGGVPFGRVEVGPQKQVTFRRDRN
jgi:hypothetical protein